MNKDDYYKKYQEEKNDEGIIVRSYDEANDKDILLKDCMLAIEQKDKQIEGLEADRRYYKEELEKTKKINKVEKIVLCSFPALLLIGYTLMILSLIFRW